jgi:thiamine-monophosphate kinase
MRVSELGERALLARIQAALEATGRPLASLVIGIGDDAAVVAPTRNAQTVLTTDAQIEGVHFERRFSTPADIGYRALAVNLSDLAAMGATARWALLSLAMPGDLAVADVEELVSSFAALAASHGTQVIGGNLSRSPGPLMVDVVAVGEVRPRRVLTRSGGQPGDELFVSGTIGGAAAGLEMLKTLPEGQGVGAPAARTERGGVTFSPGDHAGDAPDLPGLKAWPSAIADCVARYLRPEPRVRLGAAVANARAARAAIDLSDGLADAADQLAAASGCGVEIDAAALPIETAACEWWKALGQDAVLRAMGGGDDYELLFAIPSAWGGRLRHARARVAKPALTKIGRLTKDRGSRVLLREGRKEPLTGGFEHF